MVLNVELKIDSFHLLQPPIPQNFGACKKRGKISKLKEEKGEK